MDREATQTTIPAPKKQYRLSDWLDLHGLDRRKCWQICQFAGTRQNSVDSVTSEMNGEIDVDPHSPSGLTAGEAWSLAADSLIQLFPSKLSIIQRVRDKTETQFQPDVSRYPHAFTYKADSEKYPYVSCNYEGSVSDLIAVGHEFGHAVQIVASDGAFVAPVMRELCAYYSELSLLGHIKEKNTALHFLASTVRSAQIDEIRCDETLIQSVLDNTDGLYDYRWNYLLAQPLSKLSYMHLTPELLWQCFAGLMSTKALLDVTTKAVGTVPEQTINLI